jgi:hypothetical protein
MVTHQLMMMMEKPYLRCSFWAKLLPQKYTTAALKAADFLPDTDKCCVSRYTHQLFLATQLNFVPYLTFYKHMDSNANGMTHHIAYRHILGLLYT